MNHHPSTAVRSAVRALVPPMLLDALRTLRGKRTFTGDYGSWAEAAADCSGYDAPLILDKVAAAARLVGEGRSAFERDSVAFAVPEMNWPLLACLLQARAKRQGRLDLLDFGGSLGSLFFQHRSWLDESSALRWQVVEQPHFVELGQREFATPSLSFCTDLEHACSDRQPDGILLSSVLPYLEAPHELLRRVVNLGFKFVIVDRTGFIRRGRDQLTMQRVPPHIYDASYPCWFFDRAKFLAHFEKDYELKAEFPTGDHADIDGTFAGMYFERKS